MYTAYLHHPVTYLYCAKDDGMPLVFQNIMVKNVRRRGVHVSEKSYEAGHSPHLSMLGKALEVVR
jgi:hypothetical protein